ncbi:MAG TPA: beta-propeller fold lactonase family protein [Terriglobales bacterium]|nr:beta-propeller fold lactonase family protein [Terriglobales bacterium]
MKSPLRLVAMLVFPLALVVALSGCSGVQVTLTSIAVTPANASIKAGASQQFMATGTYSDNSTQDITAQATWTSGTTSVATITSGGNATGVAGGTSMITATLNGVSGNTSLTVIALSSIAVTPLNPSVALGLTQQFMATGTYSDNSTQDITSQVTWNSATQGVATISAGGLASTIMTGTSNITATLSGITSPPSTLTVTGPVPASIEIVPTNPTIAVGQAENFTALILYTDGSTQAPTGPLTWTSGTTSAASIVPAAGIAVGVATGTSLIGVTDAATTFTNNTNLTVVAAIARFAYAPNLNSQSTSVYAINATVGIFTPVSVTHDTLTPSQVIPGPSGKFAYAVESGTNNVQPFAVDPVSGALLPSGLPARSTGAGSYPFEGTIDPTGRFLYVVTENGDTVVPFSIDPSTGGLTAIGSPVSVGSNPLAVILDRTAKYLYVVNDSDGTISGFSVQADGSLMPLTTPTVPTGTFPTTPVIDPLNQYLYVPNFGDGTAGSSSVSVYSIDATGNLHEITGSPFTLPSFDAPYQAAIDPSGKFLLVGNTGDGASPGTVSVVNLVTGGGLGTEVTSSPFATGVGPTSVTIGPAGEFVAVTNFLDNTLSIFTFNSSTGALAPTFTIESQASPFFTNVSIGIAAPSVSPANVYASNSVSNDISAFTSSSGGALTPAATSPISSGFMGNTFAATDLSGKTFYTVSPAATNTQKLGAYSINQASAALTPAAASPLTLADSLGNLYAEPSGQFVYAADLASKNALAFTSGLNSVAASFGTLSSLNAIVGDPGGTLLYALGTNSITPANIGGTDGTLTPGTTQTFSGTWATGAIDPSGHFLVALDSAGDLLHSYQIAPVASGSDGVLTDTGNTASTGGTAPTSVTFDSHGRFVFVTDATAKTVTVLGFNSSTGAINATALGSATFTTVPNAVAVDATGTYLYVSVLGNPTANPSVPGSVAVYTIGSSGALTAVANSPFTAGTGTAGIAVTNKIQ